MLYSMESLRWISEPRQAQREVVRLDQWYRRSAYDHVHAEDRPWDTLLTERNLAENVNRFCVLQIIKSGDQVLLYPRAGCIRARGTSKTQSFVNKKAAIIQFKKKSRVMGGCAFEDVHSCRASNISKNSRIQ